MSFLHFSASMNLQQVSKPCFFFGAAVLQVLGAKVSHIFSVAARSNFRARKNRSWEAKVLVLLRCHARQTEDHRDTYQSQRVQAISVALLLERLPQLLDCGILLVGQVARVAVDLDGSNDGEVKVVVLGVEVDASGSCCGSHVGR